MITGQHIINCRKLVYQGLKHECCRLNLDITDEDNEWLQRSEGKYLSYVHSDLEKYKRFRVSKKVLINLWKKQMISAILTFIKKLDFYPNLSLILDVTINQTFNNKHHVLWIILQLLAITSPRLHYFHFLLRIVLVSTSIVSNNMYYINFY